MTANTSRRSLLTAIAGFLAVAALPSGWVARVIQVDPLESVLRRLRNAEAALAITAAWHAHQLAPATLDELRSALLHRIGPRGEYLTTTIADDFAHGRMILVDGWPVAECEAQLCALARLTQA